MPSTPNQSPPAGAISRALPADADPGPSALGDGLGNGGRPLLPRLAAGFAVGCLLGALPFAWLRGASWGSVHSWPIAPVNIAVLLTAGTALAMACRSGRSTASLGKPLLVAGAIMLGASWSLSAKASLHERTRCVLPPEGASILAADLDPDSVAEGSDDRPVLVGVPDDGALVTVSGVTDAEVVDVPPGSDLTAELSSGHSSARREVVLSDARIAFSGPIDPERRATVTLSERVLLRVASASWSIPCGSRVRATGWLRGPTDSRNPRPSIGAAERAAVVPPRRNRIAGWLSVPDERLIAVDQEAVDDHRAAWASVRARARQSILDGLDAARPAWVDDEAWLLLQMMLLGDARTDQASHDLERAFADAGLAHLVAISGFNLAILAGAVGALASALRCPRPAADGAAILVVVLYSLLVEPQASVTRSAMCAVGAALAGVGRRRWCSGSLLGLASTAILLDDPFEVLRPGFQLTFVAVLALRHLAPALHRRWYGDRPAPETPRAFVAHSMRSLLATTIAVWLATTPISAWHFGRVSPLAVPLSILAIPVGSALLLAGYATAALSLLSTWLATPLAWGTAALSSTLLAVALAGSSLGTGLAGVFGNANGGAPAPGTETLAEAIAGCLGHPSWPWAAAAIAVGMAWCRAQRRRELLVSRTLLAAVWIAPALIAASMHGGASIPRLRVTMLAVGDGSAILVQAGRRSMLFDAGSSSTDHCARSIVLPALDEAGIGALDAVIVSHPDLDHYSAVPTLVLGGRVRELIVTEQAIASADAEPDGGMALLLRSAAASGTRVTVAKAGDIRDVDGTEWRWLHPPHGYRARKDNDSSQVILVSSPGQAGADPVRLLLLGDLEVDGAKSLGAAMDVRTDILELPHHGAWQPGIIPLLARAGPRLVLQSTAQRRFDRDRWRTVWNELSPRAPLSDPWNGAASDDDADVAPRSLADPERPRDDVHRTERDVRSPASPGDPVAQDTGTKRDVPPVKRAPGSSASEPTSRPAASTGPSRLVTCRDGAIRVDVGADGGLLLATWRSGQWHACGRVPPRLGQIRGAEGREGSDESRSRPESVRPLPPSPRSTAPPTASTGESGSAESPGRHAAAGSHSRHPGSRPQSPSTEDPAGPPESRPRSNTPAPGGGTAPRRGRERRRGRRRRARFPRRVQDVRHGIAGRSPTASPRPASTRPAQRPAPGRARSRESPLGGESGWSTARAATWSPSPTGHRRVGPVAGSAGDPSRCPASGWRRRSCRPRTKAGARGPPPAASRTRWRRLERSAPRPAPNQAGRPLSWIRLRRPERPTRW